MKKIGWPLLIKRSVLFGIVATTAGCTTYDPRNGPPPSPGMPPNCSDSLFKDDPECVRERQNLTPAQSAVEPTRSGYDKLSLSEIPVDELSAYLRNNDTLRLPFDSTLTIIRTCLRDPENAIQSCLDAGSATQACKTDASQCGNAAAQAWQVYIAHYVKLLHTVLPNEKPEISQRLWASYVDAECEFETAPY
ncbi:hypothetical protein, partial [Sphingomonas sp. TREG-RG-20F-R18-01]|uniref:hypothetical protein n=1 Tax=Sphingomonas sp. TREG-RG-20F-R18-01 TaxID=2914982 RepID=UPI001F59F0F6